MENDRFTGQSIDASRHKAVAKLKVQSVRATKHRRRRVSASHPLVLWLIVSLSIAVTGQALIGWRRRLTLRDVLDRKTDREKTRNITAEKQDASTVSAFLAMLFCMTSRKVHTLVPSLLGPYSPSKAGYCTIHFISRTTSVRM